MGDGPPLLDLVPGHSGEAYRSWLHDRGPAFRDRVEIATLDPLYAELLVMPMWSRRARSVAVISVVRST